MREPSVFQNADGSITIYVKYGRKKEVRIDVSECGKCKSKNIWGPDGNGIIYCNDCRWQQTFF